MACTPYLTILDFLIPSTLLPVLGEFVNVTPPDIRPVVKGQPYHLKCPKHSYTRGCFYKWGRNTAFGMKHIREDIRRVILPEGTLFFSALTDQDIEEFGWKGGGYHCMLDCVLPGKKTVTHTSHAISLNQTAGEQPTCNSSLRHQSMNFMQHSIFFYFSSEFYKLWTKNCYYHQ